MRTAWVLLVALALGGCVTYREDLNRGQRLYEQNEFERALAVWRFLEQNFDSLGYGDQARYAYLRGMTDYRLSGGKGGQDTVFRRHARHWLALAKAIEDEHPGGLGDAWKTRLGEALDDLNREVWGLPPDLPSGSDVVVAESTGKTSVGGSSTSLDAGAAANSPGVAPGSSAP